MDSRRHLESNRLSLWVTVNLFGLLLFMFRWLWVGRMQAKRETSPTLQRVLFCSIISFYNFLVATEKYSTCCIYLSDVELVIGGDIETLIRYWGIDIGNVTSLLLTNTNTTINRIFNSRGTKQKQSLPNMSHFLFALCCAPTEENNLYNVHFAKKIYTVTFESEKCTKHQIKGYV